MFAQETPDGIDVTEMERPITIRHLLMHTAGLTYAWPDVFAHPVARMYVDAQTGRRDETLAEKVRRLAALPLVHQPGAGWTYGHAKELLGRLIELISGRGLDSFLQQKIFEPLEMSDTGFHVPSDRYERLARVYVTDERGGLKYEEGVNSDLSAPPTFQSPGGGLVSTAEDYARFCQMLLNGGSLGSERLLGRKTVEMMTINHTGATRPFAPFPNFPVRDGNGFGLGVRVLVDAGLADMPGSVGEYGWAGAQSTYFWIDPREQLFGVLMIQLEPFNLRYGWLFQSLAYQALVA